MDDVGTIRQQAPIAMTTSTRPTLESTSLTRRRRAPRLVERTAHCWLLLLAVPSVVTSLAPTTSSAIDPLRVAFVTGNAMKAREVEAIVSQHCYGSSSDSHGDGGSDSSSSSSSSCEVLQLDLSILNVDLPEIQEVDTLAIAKNKALLAAQLASSPCLTEDTSLCFSALGGMPGPYIKWFQQKLKSEGLYNILAAYPDKSATAVCTLAYSPAPHADPVLFTGECHGTIVEPCPGRGFGWDSIFVPDGETETFSQLSLADKNRVSHRGHAVRQWADWLGRNQEELLRRQSEQGASNAGRLLGHQGLVFSLRPTLDK